MIGPKTSVAERPHRISLQRPGPAIPDGDGGFSHSWIDLTPAKMSAQIQPATAQALERLAAGTVVSTATHIVTMPYHSQLTTKDRIVFGSRTFNVTGVGNPEQRSAETIAICAEVVT